MPTALLAAAAASAVSYLAWAFGQPVIAFIAMLAAIAAIICAVAGSVRR